jgi:lipoprotein-anchoring transpeptidase ErfK/SrfK
MHTGSVRKFRSIALALAGLACLAGGAGAQLPYPSWVRSVEVIRGGATVRSGPSTSSARRGTVRVGTLLPIAGRVLGEGCPGGEWIQIGAQAFICETLVRYSPSAPGGDEVPVVPEGELTPRAYAFVRTDGTWAYARPDDYFRDQWVESLGRGFGMAIVEQSEVNGIDMARTLSNLWIPASELRFAQPSDFAGAEIEDGSLDRIAWVVRENAPLRDRAGGRIVERASRLMRLDVAQVNGEWLRLEDGRFVSSRDAARPSVSARPQGVGENDLWVDVDTRTQTLVAYRGARPVFATLVSTGRGEHPTPRGTFRIWVKLAEDDMDDLERDDVAENYAIEAVPWVQYFEESVALHAAFWHDDFGRARSHGCVNLSPSDARRLYRFTLPLVPPGWDAVLPTDRSPGSVVRVR